MRAIVVDDSRTTCLILSRMLEEMGFVVRAAGDGREALEVLKAEGPPALMLVDWNMPVMDGLELLQAVRGDRACDRTRIVMVTTETGMERMVEALEAGANEYVMKPFTREAILEKLRVIGLEVAG